MTVFICILAQTPEQTNFPLINVTAHIWNHWRRGRGEKAAMSQECPPFQQNDDI